MSKQNNCAHFMDMVLLKSSFSVVVSAVLGLMSPVKLMRLPTATSIVLCVSSLLGSVVAKICS